MGVFMVSSWISYSLSPSMEEIIYSDPSEKVMAVKDESLLNLMENTSWSDN